MAGWKTMHFELPDQNRDWFLAQNIPGFWLRRQVIERMRQGLPLDLEDCAVFVTGRPWDKGDLYFSPGAVRLMEPIANEAGLTMTACLPPPPVDVSLLFHYLEDGSDPWVRFLGGAPTFTWGRR